MSQATSTIVARQLDAMGVELFEVGLYKPSVQGAWSEPEMLPRTWDKATLLRSVGWLKQQNSQGRNIYIRPSGEHHLSLVDDLTAASVHRLQHEGFQPTLVVETSPGNYQAWLNHGRILPKTESTLAARGLAERFDGDQGSADWRHFGRLAGFTNRKDKYRGQDGLFPFVRLRTAVPGLHYDQRDSFLGGVQEAAISRQKATLDSSESRINHGGRLLTIDDFRARAEYGGDGNRIDLAYAVYALSHAVPETSVRAAIRTRDLSKKGSESRQTEYVQRTVLKALASLEGPRITATSTRISGRSR